MATRGSESSKIKLMLKGKVDFNQSSSNLVWSKNMGEDEPLQIVSISENILYQAIGSGKTIDWKCNLSKLYPDWAIRSYIN